MSINCVICTEKLEEKNKIFLQCGHSFHCSCIFQLMSYDDKKCPLCRHEITLEVPTSNLQIRLTEAEQKFSDLNNDFALLSVEYQGNKHALEQAYHTITIKETEKQAQELDYKIRLLTKEKELDKLFKENQKLKRNTHSVIVKQKENEIVRLKNKIEKLEKDRSDLRLQVNKLDSELNMKINELARERADVYQKLKEISDELDTKRKKEHRRTRSNYNSYRYSNSSSRTSLNNSLTNNSLRIYR
jgi:predicted  nucleic acid-binding Zn-ribbon protein